MNVFPFITQTFHPITPRSPNFVRQLCHSRSGEWDICHVQLAMFLVKGNSFSLDSYPFPLHFLPPIHSKSVSFHLRLLSSIHASSRRIQVASEMGKKTEFRIDFLFWKFLVKAEFSEGIIKRRLAEKLTQLMAQEREKKEDCTNVTSSARLFYTSLTAIPLIKAHPSPSHLHFPLIFTVTPTCVCHFHFLSSPCILNEKLV